jgi:hypothetical protein
VKQTRSLTLLAGLMLLAPSVSRAQSGYTIQTVVKIGDQDSGGDFTVVSGGSFNLIGLNDSGEVVILAPGDTAPVNQPSLLDYNPSSGLYPIAEPGDVLSDTEIGLVYVASGPAQNGDTVFWATDAGPAPGIPGRTSVLAQYADGNVNVIAAKGAMGPGGGKWGGVSLSGGRTMNDQGEVVFGGQVLPAGADIGVFHWEPQTQKVTPVVMQGAHASGNITLTGRGGGWGINDRGEILFGASATDAAGNNVSGLFLLDQKKNLQTVALQGQPLPGGDAIASFSQALLNDVDNIAFVARRQSDNKPGVYLWVNGAFTATGIVGGASAPGGGTFQSINDVHLDNASPSVLVTAVLGTGFGVYRFTNGQLTTVAVPGLKLPDGATVALPPYSTGEPNAAGQVCVPIQRTDHTTGLYRLEPDGRLTVILKDGALASPGKPISLTGYQDPVAINNKGQVALIAGIGGQPAALLLTPASP